MCQVFVMLRYEACIIKEILPVGQDDKMQKRVRFVRFFK